MSRRGLGSLVLVSFLLVGGFYYAKFSYLNAPDSRALLAQAPTGASGSAAPAQSTGNGDRTECKGGETLTVTVGADGVKSSGACNLPTNTCEVIINAPDKPSVAVSKCCRPGDGVCFCSYRGAPCPKIEKFVQYKYKCTQSSHSSVRVESQVAVAQQAGSSPAKPKTIPCEDESKYLAQSSSRPPTSPTSPTGTLTPATPIPPATVTNPLPPATGQGNPLAGHATPAPGASGQQVAQTSPSSAYAGIQNAGQGSGGSTAGNSGARPSFDTTGQAFNPNAASRPGTTPGSGPLAVNRPSSYYAPTVPRAQTTFGQSNSSVSQSSSGNFLSPFVSFFGGLFSAITTPVRSTVVNLIQNIVGPVSPVVGVPVAPQQSSQGLAQRPEVVTYMPVPPPFPSDINAEIIAIANQGKNASDEPTSRAPKSPADTPVSSSIVISSGVASSSGSYGPVTGVSAGDVVRGLLDATSFAQRGAGSTSTQSASSTGWTEAIVVETGVPIVIAEAASIQSIISNFNGSWTRGFGTPSQNEAALAQAQAQYDAVVAEIGALQEAQSAGLCDETCASSLASLQSQLSIRQSRIDALDTIVQQDEVLSRSLPAPILQVERFVAGLARSQGQSGGGSPTAPTSDFAYSASQGGTTPGTGSSVSAQEPSSLSAQNPPGPPVVVSVASEENNPDPAASQTKGEAIVTRVIQSVWDFLKSWFLPPPQTPVSATEPAPRQTCSLFLSLFGGCK